ncbi:hypothetical protein BDZ89DRAFT_1135296 [Hymenopellis radicata]|nr:hypothetical protein BDZ89DRAFT_1135296 [Hymenopellis radicata]
MIPFTPGLANSELFRPLDTPAVVTLVLIENSKTVSSFWPDLRDHYVRILLSHLEARYPEATQSSFVLETLPVSGQPGPTAVRQCDSLEACLEDVRFNFDSRNVLSAVDIWNAIDILSSASLKIPGAVRNLLVVAASTPAGSSGGISNSSSFGGDQWSGLAEGLAQADIQCHMVLSIRQDVWVLNALFNETMLLQQSTEQSLRLPTETDTFTVRYSVKSHRHGDASAHHPRRFQDPLTNSSFRGDFGQNPQALSSSTQETCVPTQTLPPTSANEPPSLVAQLQQVHGLTKKKVYGAKPVRAPFFRDEKPTVRNLRTSLTMKSPSPRLRHASTSPISGRMHPYGTTTSGPYTHGAHASPSAMRAAPSQPTGRTSDVAFPVMHADGRKRYPYDDEFQSGYTSPPSALWLPSHQPTFKRAAGTTVDPYPSYTEQAPSPEPAYYYDEVPRTSAATSYHTDSDFYSTGPFDAGGMYQDSAFEPQSAYGSPHSSGSSSLKGWAG